MGTDLAPEIEEMLQWRVLTAHPMAVEHSLRTAVGLRAISRQLSACELVLLSAAITGPKLTELADEVAEVRAYAAERSRSISASRKASPRRSPSSSRTLPPT